MELLEKSRLSRICSVHDSESGLHFIIKLDTKYDESDIRKKLEDKDIRLQSVSDYLMIPDESKSHLYIINYSNLDMENIGQVFDEIYDIVG